MILGEFGTPAKGLFRDYDGDVFYVAVKDAEGRAPTGDSLFCNLVGIFGVDYSLPKAISAEGEGLKSILNSKENLSWKSDVPVFFKSEIKNG